MSTQAHPKSYQTGAPNVGQLLVATLQIFAVFALWHWALRMGRLDIATGAATVIAIFFLVRSFVFQLGGRHGKATAAMFVAMVVFAMSALSAYHQSKIVAVMFAAFVFAMQYLTLTHVKMRFPAPTS